MRPLSLLVLLSACASDDRGQDTSLSAISTGSETTDPIPVGGNKLVRWLKQGTYLSWAAEPAAHPGLGPHFGDVRVFVNEPLDASLRAGETEHPVGSASVKELYGDASEVQGWAVMIKVAEGTGGDTWHWFEEYAGTQYADDVGASLCTGCHSGGTDYVLTEWPSF